MSGLCTWTDDGESWTLRLTMPVDLVPPELGISVEGDSAVGVSELGNTAAEAGDASEPARRKLFADLNGVTDRRDVPGGLMALAESEQGSAFVAELRVPRGFRGSLDFMPVPVGIDEADRETWLAALDEAFIPQDTGLRIVNDMFGRPVFEISAPDARPLIWTADTGASEEEVEPAVAAAISTEERADDAESAGPVERVEALDSTPRRVWTYRPERAPASAPVLVVFDGRAFIDGGLLTAVDELVSPPSLVLAVDHAPLEPASDSSAFELRASDLVMNPRFCDEVLALVDRLAPESRSRSIIAGASYGGLAAAYFALRRPQECRGICLSPSFWETDAQGRRIWDHVPGDAAAADPRPEFLIDHGTLETAIADSVAVAVPEFSNRGLSVETSTFSGGHEYLWWRELLLVHLAEVLADTPALSKA